VVSLDNVKHHILLAKVVRTIQDAAVMGLLKMMLAVTGKQVVPQGGVISPLLSNLYLTEVDRMLERAKETTRCERFRCVEYARFADDLVIWIDAYRRQRWLRKALEKRLREQLAKLEVEINEEKSRVVDLAKGEKFAFPGFDFRRTLSNNGVWRPQYTPRMKKRTALLVKLREISRRFMSQPVERVIERINPILRGWVHYFAVGHLSRCFSFVKDWAEKKIRRHMIAGPKRKGFGWQRWSRRWLYDGLGLFKDYRVRRAAGGAESQSSMTDHINLEMKRAGKPSAGNLPAGFDVAGAGNRLTVRLVRHSQRKRGATDRPKLRGAWRQSSTLLMSEAGKRGGAFGVSARARPRTLPPFRREARDKAGVFRYAPRRAKLGRRKRT
jgi:Reverse transcriptase (RNA-dependent DNA polymerase)/Group II intron, maturase-specific domain